jgi:hypothetical protein
LIIAIRGRRSRKVAGSRDTRHTHLTTGSTSVTADSTSWLRTGKRRRCARTSAPTNRPIEVSSRGSSLRAFVRALLIQRLCRIGRGTVRAYRYRTTKSVRLRIASSHALTTIDFRTAEILL